MKLKYTLLALAAMTGVASAASIAVNFGGSGGNGQQTITSGEAAGVNRATNWINSGAASDSVTSDGITVTWASEESWGEGSATGVDTADTALMSGWLSANDSPSSTGSIDVTNLVGTYDLYIYFASDRPDQLNSISEDASVFAASSILEDVVTGAAGTLIDPFVYNQGDGAGGAGNYLLFTGLSAATLNITFDNGTDNRAGIAGIQIVEQVPEPTSTALLGLGGLALILRRRK